MRSLRPLIVALLLLPSLAPAAFAAEEEPAQKAPARPGAYYSRYQTRYLDAYAAQALAWDQCPKKEACEIKGLGQGRGAVLDVNVDAATHERIARALAEHDTPRTLSFQLVVLAAGNKPNGEPPGLSKGAQKALDDIEAFLPFKSYRVLDTALLRVTQDDEVKGRVAGLAPLLYGVTLRFRSGGTSDKLVVDHFLLEEQNTGEDLLQTSFAMNVGETVVVGTSSVAGAPEALVALLTALP